MQNIKRKLLKNFFKDIKIYMFQIPVFVGMWRSEGLSTSASDNMMLVSLSLSCSLMKIAGMTRAIISFLQDAKPGIENSSLAFHITFFDLQTTN